MRRYKRYRNVRFAEDRLPWDKFTDTVAGKKLVAEYRKIQEAGKKIWIDASDLQDEIYTNDRAFEAFVRHLENAYKMGLDPDSVKWLIDALDYASRESRKLINGISSFTPKYKYTLGLK